MKLTIFKILIIIAIIVLSFLFYRNLNDVNEKIANQDIVLDLVANHDRYHEIYMKQFEGSHSKEETQRIINEVYLKDSNKIIKPQIQLGNISVKAKEDISEEELNKYRYYKFTYNDELDVLKIEGIKEWEGSNNE